MSVSKPALRPGPLSVICFSAVVMSLGWGLRGTIGGGPFGAMIPGAMLALCLCLVMDLRKNLPLIVAFSAIGIGFGGQMTYGQTIGFIRDPQTFWWGFLGLTLKGAAWGLLGGVILGMGLMSSKYRRWEIVLSLLLMVGGTFVGWLWIDHPKLVYFSNRIDRPREELLIGMYLGVLYLLIVPLWRRRESLSLELGLWGLLFGGIGFGGGGLFMALSGIVPKAYATYPYWKGMEFTFGACLGVGYAIGCLRNQDLIRSTNGAEGRADSDWGAQLPDTWQSTVAVGLVMASLAWQFGLAFKWEYGIPAQGMYTILGAMLLMVAISSQNMAVHVGLSLTVLAYYRDTVASAYKPETHDDHRILWGMTLALAPMIVAYYGRWWPSRLLPLSRMLLHTSWVATIVCFCKILIIYNVPWTQTKLLVEEVMLAELLLITYWCARWSKLESAT